MSDQEKTSATNVQANNNSTAVNNIEIDGPVGRDVKVGGIHTTNVYNYASPEAIKTSDLITETIGIRNFEPETILISKGSFWMGTRGEDISVFIKKFGGDEDHYKNEIPGHEVLLSAYRIGKYPVTNLQYKKFVDSSEPDKRQSLINPIMRWNGLNIPDGRDDFPVVGVTWYQAIAYCRWLSHETDRNYQLPNEAQWEKACRGGKNYFFPWGDEFDPSRCNHGSSGIAAADPARPAQNDYGLLDFVGNILQWTCSLWGSNFLIPDTKYAYPWKNDRRNEVDANSQIRRVVRGSSFKAEKSDLRCTIRQGALPESWVTGIGFRVVIVEE